MQTSANTFLGVCRSLWSWVTLNHQNLLGVGTHLKFYVENGGVYNDITPIRSVSTLTNPFATTALSPAVTVTDAAGGFTNGDFVTFYGSTAVGGLTLLGEYQIRYLGGATYTIVSGLAATSSATGGGTVYAAYQVNTGYDRAVPQTGWGAGSWGAGSWGSSAVSLTAICIWNQTNYGQDLLYGQRNLPLYYWQASTGYQDNVVGISVAAPGVVSGSVSVVDGQAVSFTTAGALPTPLIPGKTYYARDIVGLTYHLAATAGGAAITTTGAAVGQAYLSPRGQALTALSGAAQAPLSQTFFLVSDASRFVLCFGTNDVYQTTVDPMLIRWSDQENLTEWEPLVTNQAGSLRLSHGSKIVAAAQSRQEIVVFTDSSLYALQYLGAPYVWGNQLLSDNISLIGPSAVAVAASMVYWMGKDKFYVYDGSVRTLSCDLRQYVYGNINLEQGYEVFASTNEGFNEVWFFYCTADSITNNAYVVFNYLENVWYYGSMARTAWLDTGIRDYPIAATYSSNTVYHEFGVDDGETLPVKPISTTLVSSEFDIGDGHNFAYVWRMLPDLTFRGSSPGINPTVTLYLQPLKNSGSGYTNPASVGGLNADASASVVGVVPINVDQYTGEVFIRIRARQMSIRITSNQVGCQWQLGAPRIDLRQDGRR